MIQGCQCFFSGAVFRLPISQTFPKALVKEQGDTLKIKESETENKEKYIKELEDKNQKLAESIKIHIF
jgi:hypothetical protein